MSFSDPQTVTIGSDTISLPRVSVGNRQSEYASADGNVSLKASSAIGSRTRRVARLDHKKISADLFLPDTSVARSMSCYVVFDLPAQGYSPTEALDVYKGLVNQLNASTYAVVQKLLNGES